MQDASCDIGLIGLAVMGQNLASWVFPHPPLRLRWRSTMATEPLACLPICYKRSETSLALILMNGSISRAERFSTPTGPDMEAPRCLPPTTPDARTREELRGSLGPGRTAVNAK
jgi:hypothetical protein